MDPETTTSGPRPLHSAPSAHPRPSSGSTAATGRGGQTVGHASGVAQAPMREDPSAALGGAPGAGDPFATAPTCVELARSPDWPTRRGEPEEVSDPRALLRRDAGGGR